MLKDHMVLQGASLLECRIRALTVDSGVNGGSYIRQFTYFQLFAAFIHMTGIDQQNLPAIAFLTTSVHQFRH